MAIPNLDKLLEKCRALGYEPKPRGKKLGKEDCIQVLRTHHLPAGGLPYSELTPMLCFASWNLKPEEEAKIWASPNWAVQKKLNGCRLVLHFVNGVGVFAHSRTVSLKTWRYQELTEQLLWHDYVPSFSATLDCEVIVEKAIDTRGYTVKGELTKSSLHSTTALLHLAPESSRKLQRDQDCRLQVKVFDVTNLQGNDLKGAAQLNRQQLLETTVRGLLDATPMAADFEIMELVRENKKAYFEKVLADGGEGVIGKNLRATYEDSSSRGRDAWVKFKRRTEFDAFVSGFKPGEPDSGWADLVGALEFSVHTIQGRDHPIAYTTNLPLELRKAITETVDGKPQLRKDWYGRVAEVSGQDLSARELRLSHATLDRWRYEAGPDHKDEAECIVNMDDLKEAAAWAG